MRVDVVQGPNLNLLGRREPEIYGGATLETIHSSLSRLATQLGGPEGRVELSFFQSNSEGALVDRLQAMASQVDAFILNPAGYTHTSVALRDALIASGLPAIEVHLSNVYARESFRHRSLIADVVRGSIVGLGPTGYLLALRALVEAHQATVARGASHAS
jgi:3-dehydroquinate dehydratase II